MSDGGGPTWKFLTNHAHVLVCIANDPGGYGCARSVSTSASRSVRRIASWPSWSAASYITRERHGQRNRYTINADLPRTRRDRP